MPVIFGPYFEKLRDRDEEGPRARRRPDADEAEPDADADADAGAPVGRRVAIGLLVAGTVGALAVYVRRLSGGETQHDSDVAPPDE